MSYLIGSGKTLKSSIEQEIAFPGEMRRGRRNNAVRTIQEWLNLHGSRIAIDRAFGPATERAVICFQRSKGLPETGVVDEATHTQLVKPMLSVLKPPAGFSAATVPEAAGQFAQIHLQAHPREVGGANMGPWVRLYMGGNEGSVWLWCAGFVSFVVKQAAEAVSMSAPIAGSYSCDRIAQQGMENGFYLDEAIRSTTPLDELPQTCVFLVRRSADDWIHAGFVTRFRDQSFDTIEGNTNDEGHREGYEVCARIRAYQGKDYVRLGM